MAQSSNSKPKRLVHVTTVPMTLGFLRGQLDFMTERGYQIEVITSPGDSLGQFAEEENVSAHAIPMQRRPSPFRDVLSLFRLWHRIRTINPVIVHAHTPKAGFLGMIAASMARVPVRVYHMRGLPLITAGWPLRTLLRWCERLSCALAHRVICVSKSLREVAIFEGLCTSHKLLVLGHGSSNGVDAYNRFNPDRFLPRERAAIREHLGISKDALVIGFIGRVVRDKGVSELHRAWQGIRNRFSEAHLLIVGPAERGDRISKSIIESFSNDVRVHIVDFVRDPATYYSIMDLVVLPTYREGFPNVALEAASMRLPIVATKVVGCIDAVEDRVTGILVPVRDSSALESALTRYLADSQLARQHGDAGRKRALTYYRPQLIWDELYNVYQKLTMCIDTDTRNRVDKSGDPA